MGKVLETIILRRLERVVSPHLSDEQFGFIAAHSTVHQTIRAAELITRGFEHHRYTGALILDIKKAFNEVWHQGLIFKLIRIQFNPYLIKIIASFLSYRDFRVLQGSVLSLLLYSVFRSDFPAIFTQSLSPHLAIHHLRTAIDSIEEWFSKWRIQVNFEKSHQT